MIEMIKQDFDSLALGLTDILQGKNYFDLAETKGNQQILTLLTEESHNSPDSKKVK